MSLVDRLDAKAMRGRISIIPVVNQSAAYHQAIRTPADGKNLHWLFPGDRDGSHSEALAHHLLFDWAAGAELLVDLHGGDIGEVQSPYVVFQQTGNAEIDARHELLARCFATDLLVAVEPASLLHPGRSCTALGKLGRSGLVTEAGDHAVLTRQTVDWHIQGVLNAARCLGMLDDVIDVELGRSSAVIIEDYTFVSSPVNGLYVPCCEPGDHVRKGETLGKVRDELGNWLTEIKAPQDGILMWRWCMQMIMANAWVGAVGRPRRPDQSG